MNIQLLSDSLLNKANSGLLQAWSCRQHVELYAFTAGYPVLPEERVQAPGCPLAAAHKDWNEYASRFQTCPVTGMVQTPLL